MNFASIQTFFDEGKEKRVWQEIKRLAKDGNTERLIQEFERIKSENLLGKEELETLLNTALTSSISSEHPNTALQLLDYGCPAEPCESLALRLASSMGYESVVLKCIEKGADPSIGGGMILSLAITKDHKTTIKTLLKMFESEDKRPNMEDIVKCANSATQNFMPDVARKVLELLKTKELEKLKLNTGNHNGVLKEVIELSKTIISSRRKKTLKGLMEQDTEILS